MQEEFIKKININGGKIVYTQRAGYSTKLQ